MNSHVQYYTQEAPREEADVKNDLPNDKPHGDIDLEHSPQPERVGGQPGNLSVTQPAKKNDQVATG